MPYKIDDLLAPGMDKPIKTIESKVKQPAIPVEEPKQALPKKPTKTQRKITMDKKPIKETSPIVKKAADILTVVLMSSIAVAIIALIIRGIQFLFSI